MTSQYRHRRTSNPATVVPNPIEPGEIAVNTANRQISVGDANGATLGAPLALLAVRLFDTRAIYAPPDWVVNGAALYRCKAATGPGAFDPSKWDTVFVQLAGDTMTGPLVLSADPAAPMQAATRQYVDAGDSAGNAAIVAGLALKVAKAGDTMTGPLALPGDPTLDPQAASKHYVDAGDTAVSNAGNAAIALKVAKAGDTMTGALNVPNLPAADNSTKVPNTAFLTANVMRTDMAQAMTPAQQLTGRQTIYAAPLDALAYNGLQINGSMDVSQQLGAFNSGGWLNYSGYTVDGWFSRIIQATPGSTAFSVGQVAPPGAPAFGGAFPLCLYMSSTPVAANFAGANDRATFEHRVEGYRWSKLGFGQAIGSSPVTIGFWVIATIPGTGCLTLVSQGAATRMYIAEFTINAANTWEYKVITIPPDTSGAANWLTTNGIGAYVQFQFGGGSAFKGGTANVWNGNNTQFATANLTNFFANNNNMVGLTGVVILPGSDAPSAARSPLIMRPYSEELRLAQRQLHYIQGDATNTKVVGVGQNGGGTTQVLVNFPVSMRAYPTFSNGGGINLDYGNATYNATAASISYVALERAIINIATGGSIPNAYPITAWLPRSTAAFMFFDARI